MQEFIPTQVIRLLPEHLSNKIAAGEVVQRPASVVKELMENAIDAGATEITLSVKDAGKQLIQVSDNGKGMSFVDAMNCFQRHATSKISSENDLENIITMGFRGEAMASIAAVAQVELKTKQADSSTGTLVKIEGGDLIDHSECAASNGTTVAVKNLFFNVPARRNFLRSNPTELRFIQEEFTRVAMAWPDRSFRYVQNDLEIYKLAPAKLGKRIQELLGKQSVEKLIPCTLENDYVNIIGYVGRPEYAKSVRGDQYFFVNKRFVRHSGLSAAVKQAFEGLIGKEEHPLHVLFFDIEPRHTEINISPNKSEIKFDDERTVFALTLTAVRNALSEHQAMPAIDFEAMRSDRNFHDALQNNAEGTTLPDAFLSSDIRRPSNLGQSPSSTSKPSNTRGWEKMFEPLSSTEWAKRFEDITQDEQDLPTKPLKLFSSAVNKFDEEASEYADNGNRFVVQLHRRYILTHTKEGLMVIDQHRAHQKVIMAQLLKQNADTAVTRRVLLFPQHYIAEAGDYAIINAYEAELKNLGFELELTEAEAIIKVAPAGLPDVEVIPYLEEILYLLKHDVMTDPQKARQGFMQKLSDKMAVKYGTVLGEEEMQDLMHRLFLLPDAAIGVDGKPVLKIMTLSYLGNYLS